MQLKRILLKLSGEALMGTQDHGIDPDRLSQYASEIVEAASAGTQIAIVIGGGNIFRGLSGAAEGMDRTQGDYMGMMATVINSLALQAELEKQGAKTALFSGMLINPIAIPMSARSAISELESGKIILISGGTGNPYFTTDSASALRALEIKANIILKGTRVDGVYTADPEKDPNAKKYETLSYDEALEKGLLIMDQTAFTMCRENNMPVYVFNMNKKGNLKKVLGGNNIGTLIS
ncbi:MAG: UMP kinase [Bacteroidetes bacterium]|nr:UMP kinase [Bacteroidota bacterium]MCK5764344.1 UMP kinase [Bacteroidales bacterium]